MYKLITIDFSKAGFIEVIKMVRYLTGAGLMEARNALSEMRHLADSTGNIAHALVTYKQWVCAREANAHVLPNKGVSYYPVGNMEVAFARIGDMNMLFDFTDHFSKHGGEVMQVVKIHRQNNSVSENRNHPSSADLFALRDQISCARKQLAEATKTLKEIEDRKTACMQQITQMQSKLSEYNQQLSHYGFKLAD